MTTGIRTIETQVLAEGEWLSVTQVCRGVGGRNEAD